MRSRVVTVVYAEWRSPEGERWGWTLDLGAGTPLEGEALLVVLGHAQGEILEGFQLQDERVRLEDVTWWVERRRG